MSQSAFPGSDTVAGLNWLSEPIINSKFCGDVWSCAWADDDNLYAAADDTWGPDFTGGNLGIFRIDGDPLDSEITLINKMESYGAAGWIEERASWKANGLTCVDGVLYLSVSQHAYWIPAGDNIQRTYDATIVKSTDYGQTWSTKPDVGKPMFPGHWFSNPFFVQYGRDYTDTMDEFVYAVSNGGSWNNGNYLALGRVHRDKLGALDAADWEFYGGLGDGLEPVWVKDFRISHAVFIDRNNTSMAGIQYVPALKRFVLMEWAYTDLDDPGRPFSNSKLCLYESTKPWGPWRHIHTEPNWNNGSYNPGLPAKWFEDGGKRMWLTSAGDFYNRHNSTATYDNYHFTVQKLELVVK